MASINNDVTMWKPCRTLAHVIHVKRVIRQNVVHHDSFDKNVMSKLPLISKAKWWHIIYTCISGCLRGIIYTCISGCLRGIIYTCISGYLRGMIYTCISGYLRGIIYTCISGYLRGIIYTCISGYLRGMYLNMFHLITACTCVRWGTI